MTATCTFNEQTYLSLSIEIQIKVEHIYYIASTLHDYRLPRLSPKEFDELYDMSTEKLEQLSGLVRFKVQASHYGQMIQSMKRKPTEDDGC